MKTKRWKRAGSAHDERGEKSNIKTQFRSLKHLIQVGKKEKEKKEQTKEMEVNHFCRQEKNKMHLRHLEVWGE